MKIISMSVFTIIFFSFNYLNALEINEFSFFNEMEASSSRVPLFQLEPLLNTEEKQIASSSCLCSLNFYAFLDIFSSFWKSSLGEEKTLQRTLIYNQDEQKNILLLPNEIILEVTKFLNSIDILRLSGSCKKFQQIFNDYYWSSYLSQKPKALSCLILNKHLSPSLDRKLFFSHLWYVENRINLAAKLGHPEAVVHKNYSCYGAYIRKDQYLCHSGVIKSLSGKIDVAKTEALRKAQKRKIKADMERLRIENQMVINMHMFMY